MTKQPNKQASKQTAQSVILKNGLSAGQVRSFRKTVRDFYRAHRRVLPWRTTHDPYQVLVSEIMLQQTQVDRVVPMYRAFIEKFPTARHLARAPLADVLRLWSGLGYNRRARFLQQCAQVLVAEYGGNMPRDESALRSLPGIGPYTARAVMVFAYNIPTVLIETNIRSVFLHTFYQKKKSVHDETLLPLIEQTFDRKNPREWYSALMDYGTFLKSTYGNPNIKSAHYAKQSRFEGSRRQLRGRVLRTLLEKSANVESIAQSLEQSIDAVMAVLEQFESEKIIRKKGKTYHIA